jgi:hypothetical protein
MRQVRDLTGKKFDAWTVIGRSNRTSLHNGVYWDCLCECGHERAVTSASLTNGRSTSCGCKRGTHRQTIGGKSSKAYFTWTAIKQRCCNPKNKFYPRYGGRGITICDRWLGPEGFENFLKDMGVPEPGMSIDRTDNNQGYNPENCRWATRKEQQRNRSVTVKLSIGGREFSLAAVAEVVGLERTTLSKRIENGWSVKLTLEKD